MFSIKQQLVFRKAIQRHDNATEVVALEKLCSAGIVY